MSLVLRWLSTRSNMTLKSVLIPTEPFNDQQPGTSGLRKPVKVFQKERYTENFVQSILSYIGEDNLVGSTLVVGGDGRFFCREAVLTIIRICAAHKVKDLYVGQNGLLSTPAASNLIRKLKAIGGIILTASHNPGGPDKDFGIKFNIANGGPAPSNVTQSIFEISGILKEYKIVPDLECSLDNVAQFLFQVDDSPVTVHIIDPVEDYVALMREIFDFDKIKKLFNPDRPEKAFKILVDCMHGVTGPYASRLFYNEFGAVEGSVINAVPLVDFGGGHPDPNLTYAKALVKELRQGVHDFGVAFDGDGDRNMVLGKAAFFVTPSDSLAVLCAHLHCIPYFQKHGIKGFARSMPTAAAVDRVAEAKGLSSYETPTGWKFFGNLLDAGLISVCGEESFGTGSSHIREKDGIWAALAWLSVIAHTNKSVEEILHDHWLQYGRNFALRYDYENLELSVANDLMKKLEEAVSKLDFRGSVLAKPPDVPEEYQVAVGDNFSYTDPVDKSITQKQGIRITFTNGSRAVFRLSGTGSTGATLRVYFETYHIDPDKLTMPREVLMKPLIDIALKVARVQEITKRDTPTVIT